MRRSPSEWLLTDEPQRFGSGWISGTAGAVLGIAALGTAACLALPAQLTAPALRAWYPVPLVKGLLLAAMLLAFVLGCLSLVLRRKKTLGLVAIGSGLAAAALVAFVPRAASPTSPMGLGLDVFVLNLVLYSLLFVPLERIWPLRAAQPTFRPEWWTDLAWFASSALLVQLTTFLVLEPARAVAFAALPAVQDRVRALPVLLQVPLVVVLADTVQYWVHRASHAVPLLWRFHAIHHSATALDWLAGSRLHVVDAVLTRALVWVPLYLLGFDLAAVAAYLVLVSAQATFVHANVCWRLRWLEPLFVTPRFHHWHHAEAAANVNFAVHLPWLDRLFGTHHLPGTAWPERYGLAGGVLGPRGFWAQLVAPFVRAAGPRR